jgi:biopolymer transport protein ExbB
MKRSPFYEIYHIGAEEITARVSSVKSGHKGLSGRSIQAVRAALDAGLVNLQHKLTNGLVYLTISIAGGPYVGLLGTVVGVMITFAIISKEGEVNVNAIAPGIASALLATVAGLIVAIPALFAYSYLNNRIKNITSEVKVFIDEFVSKMAEYYPQVNEAAAPKFSDSDEV